MKTNADTLVDLFRTNVRFVVPPFQRPYVWTMENWEALWGDLTKAADLAADHAADRATDHVDGTGETANHFLGAVVLEHQPSPSSNTKVHRVIDGQQRLVTLQLLFAAARDVAQECGVPERLTTSFRRLTDNDDETSEDYNAVFKVVPTKADRIPFRHAMTGGPQAVHARYRRDKPTIVQAYLYFVDQLRAWTQLFAPEEVPAAFDHLVEVCNVGMYAVVIQLESTDNPQAIFESLNARGLPLQASDLVRNYLFRVAAEQGLPAEPLYEEHWARFDDGRWRETVTRGRLKHSRMDAFLSDLLTMELRHGVSPQQIFLTFRKYIEQSPLPLPDLMERVAAYGDIYHCLDVGAGNDISPYEEGFLRRLKALDTSVLFPVLLRVFAEHDAAVREPVIKALDSFLWRRILLRLPTKNYNRLMLDLLRALDDSPSDPAGATEAFLAGQTAESNFWPSDEDIVRAVTTMDAYHRVSKARLKVILDMIDNSLHTSMNEYLVRDLGSLSLEHLMPQSWEKWPLTSTSAAERRRLIHTLGNLTLATPDLNHKMGNAAWPAKRRALLELSALNLNRSLPEAWNEKAIQARGRSFAAILLSVLGRPPSLTNSAEPPEPEPDPDAPEAITEHDQPADDSGTRPRPRKPGAVAAHIIELLKAQPPGTVLTVSQLAHGRTSHYPDGNASGHAIRERLNRGTVSGVETTTNQKGYRAARLSDRAAPTDRMSRARATLRPLSSHREVPPLEARFDAAIGQLCTRAGEEVRFPVNGVRAMIDAKGGLWAAKQLLSEATVSDGFLGLARRGRLDLTVECLALQEEYSALFTEDEKATAKARLAEFEPPEARGST